MKALRIVLPVLALAAAFAVVASGFGSRFGAWDWRKGFAILAYGTYAGLAVAALAFVLLLVPRTRRGSTGVLALSLAVALAAAALPLYWRYQAGALPPINDITTDFDNPPQYIAIVPLRAGFPVSAEYGGEATAKAQRAGYPDIVPILRKDAPSKAYAAALAVARDMGWTIVAADEQTGRIEAMATTPWFGFKDDVVIRVSPAPDGSRVDIRSHSRLGKGDIGANARRVREFTAQLARR
jgi:uncharacterized protein (DUF1499 family)